MWAQNWLKRFLARAGTSKFLHPSEQYSCFTPGLRIRHFLYFQC